MPKKRINVKPDSVKKAEEKPKARSKSTKTESKTLKKVLAEMVPVDKGDSKKLPSDNRFERHKASGDQPKRNEINEKLKSGQVRWAFYAIDGDHGYQYYLKIKK